MSIEQGDKDMLKNTTVSIRGIAPLLMHNGQLADPLNPHTQALAKLTSKRNKTLDDHRAVSRAEWIGSLYVNDAGHPCLPGEVIEGALCEGAKKFKLGKVAKGGIIVAGDFVLEYDGPKAIDALWNHGGFLKRAGVRVTTSRVIRSRPIFPAWACTFSVQWDSGLVKDEDQLFEIVGAAGQTGIGDWRPKFGRFELVG